MRSSDVTGFGPPADSAPPGSAAQPLEPLTQTNFGPRNTQRLAVICAALEDCAPSYVVERSSFPFYALEYVLSGSGRLVVAGIAHELGPGSVYSYGPRVVHRLSGMGTEKLSKYVVCFTGTEARYLLCSCGLPPGSVSQVSPIDRLVPLFEEIVQNVQREGGGTDLRPGLLECLAIELGRSRPPCESSNANAPRAAAPATVAFATYQRCRRHIEAHFERLRTLDEVATECHTSSPYMCRLFRAYDGQSPYQYLLRLKMWRAADLLRQPGALVKQVAEELGFPDAFHFSRVFHKVVGVAPSTLRKAPTGGSGRE